MLRIVGCHIYLRMALPFLSGIYIAFKLDEKHIPGRFWLDFICLLYLVIFIC